VRDFHAHQSHQKAFLQGSRLRDQGLRIIRAGQSGRTVGHADDQLMAKRGEGEEFIGHSRLQVAAAKLLKGQPST